jgi:hypothetical protein
MGKWGEIIKVPRGSELFSCQSISGLEKRQKSANERQSLGMKKDDPVNLQRLRLQPDDGLGPTSDIGSRLRALYGAVQEEGVPDQLLDLLEKLDNAERAQTKQTSQGRE